MLQQKRSYQVVLKKLNNDLINDWDGMYHQSIEKKIALQRKFSLRIEIQNSKFVND